MIGCRRQLPRAVAIGYGRLLMSILVSTATIAPVLVIGLWPRRAVSLPLYARQTGPAMRDVRPAFLELTPFGRRFKPAVTIPRPLCAAFPGCLGSRGYVLFSTGNPRR